MGQEVDRLEIAIEANARSANTQLTNLIGRLNKVSTALNSVNGSGLNGLASGVQRLGNAMQAMNGVKTTDFSRLARNLTNMMYWFEAYDFEFADWAKNNMDWDDVKDKAFLISKKPATVDFQEEWVNGHYKYIKETE